VGDLAGDVLQVVRPRSADNDGVIQREGTGGKLGRPRPGRLSEAWSADSHFSL
jgi:hypothetical protein